MGMLDNIKFLSKEKGWSLSFLASKLGLTASYFTDVKNGKTQISNDRLAIIADILDTTPEYLKGETDIKEKTPAEPDVTFDDFTYAMHNESKELSDADKEMLLEMARMMKERIKKEKRE